MKQLYYMVTRGILLIVPLLFLTNEISIYQLQTKNAWKAKSMSLQR